MRVEDIAGGDQDRLLDQAAKVVRTESFEMKRCLDKGKIMDAMKHALNFLSELKTNELSPKFYYRLYMDVVNELHHLECYLVDEYERCAANVTSLNLYECVQYAASIVPRLYLLVTVAVVYIKCDLGTKPEILNDIVEMCRGVQHPLRGLFLRNYLLQTTRSLLPDNALENIKEVDENRDPAEGVNQEEGTVPLLTKIEEKNAGTVRDAVAFILLNFAEMNKLWVRMQHQGPTKEREKREKDRMELRILVGTNLVRLSQLDSLTDEMYVKEVLPSILEQVVSCKDYISQEYLMECVIQVFDDEKHFATLRDFLNACSELSPEVNVKNILIALIDRLAIYATQPNGKGIPAHLQLFDIFSEQSKELIKARKEMPVEDIIALHNALVSLAIKCYPDKTEFCNITFGSLKCILEDKGVQCIEAFGPVGRELSKLLHLPVDEYNNILRVAELAEYVPVMETMDYRGRCHNSAYLLQNMMEHDTLLKTEENLAVLCAFVDSLLVDQQDQPSDAHESEDFEDEQRLLARMVHLIQADTIDGQFLVLNNLRKVLGAGGKHRIKFTLAPVVFAIYKLIIRYADEREETFNEKVKKMFVCAMGTIGALISTGELDELPLKLYLEGAVVSDKVNFDESATITYEFMSKALSVLEDDIADSRDRVRCLALSVGSLLKIQHLHEENWSPLATQMVLAASKMFKKADQVRSLCSCASLFWIGETAESGGLLKNGSKVADVIKKSIKIATQCMEPIVQQQLFIHILETCLFFYFDGCTEISEESIIELVTRTKDNAVQLDVSAEADALDKQFAAVLQFVKSKKSEFVSLAEKLHL